MSSEFLEINNGQNNIIFNISLVKVFSSCEFMWNKYETLLYLSVFHIWQSLLVMNFLDLTILLNVKSLTIGLLSVLQWNSKCECLLSSFTTCIIWCLVFMSNVNPGYQKKVVRIPLETYKMLGSNVIHHPSGHFRKTIMKHVQVINFACLSTLYT